MIFISLNIIRKYHIGVELRAAGDLNRSEKPGWSAGDMDKLPRKLLRHPVSPKRVFSSKKLTCLKSEKTAIVFLYLSNTKKLFKIL